MIGQTFEVVPMSTITNTLATFGSASDWTLCLPLEALSRGFLNGLSIGQVFSNSTFLRVVLSELCL